MYAFKRLLLPVAREYMPDLIVVACGFDAATCDPIGMCNVSPECYGAMTAMLRGVCSKVVLSLEGGYNLDAIANSALGCVKALLGIRWSAGLVPQAASFNAYATLSEAEINGVQTGKLVYEAGWLALPKWDPAVEVPECVRAQPSELGKQVVDRVAGEVGRYWQSL
ncbi:Histone deacetylase hda1 [Coemansia sp. RSA 2673]|nr:Histone deacetylase hda1 [Coemansia sp. RSA 2673]